MKAIIQLLLSSNEWMVSIGEFMNRSDSIEERIIQLLRSLIHLKRATTLLINAINNSVNARITRIDDTCILNISSII